MHRATVKPSSALRLRLPRARAPAAWLSGRYDPALTLPLAHPHARPSSAHARAVLDSEKRVLHPRSMHMRTPTSGRSTDRALTAHQQ
ncbi:hypothetical protein FA95DRAFT_1613580 [Auriscalpium vulgare]|uniref:Uncharacterized protein n=1 Tax=Auriscalpium vulgare TaxID=40419 RepID=A0ACB8R355_9AGAM|nr:hypothetical protein FA95DRAFT_1613580 [Auriscalpium vulgare]